MERQGSFCCRGCRAISGIHWNQTELLPYFKSRTADTIMEKIDHYTPYEILLIKGSFMYFLGLAALTIVATIFLLIAQVNIVDIMKPVGVNMLGVGISWIIYRKKRQRKKTTVLSWI